jgi:putative redox protein
VRGEKATCSPRDRRPTSNVSKPRIVPDHTNHRLLLAALQVTAERLRFLSPRARTTVTYEDGLRFRAIARGHELICDQLVENGGSDAGMTPPELLLASLGTCVMYYAAEYLRARGMSAAGLTITVSAQKGQKPARLVDFKVTLGIPGVDEPRHREGVLRAARSCLIHNTLTQAPAIEIELEGNYAEADEHQPNLAAKL